MGDEIWFIGPDNAGYLNTQEVAKRLREAGSQFVLQVKRKGILPPQPIRDIQLKVFSNLGYTEVAKALELMSENTSDAAVKALQELGQGDEAMKYQTGLLTTALDAEAKKQV